MKLMRQGMESGEEKINVENNLNGDDKTRNGRGKEKRQNQKTIRMALMR